MDVVAIIGAVGTFFSVVLIPFALKWRAESRAAAGEARQAKMEAADREQAAYVAAYQEAMKTKDGEAKALREDNTALREENGVLQDHLGKCEQSFAKALTCILFQEQDRKKKHQVMAAAGMPVGEFEPMPVHFDEPIADPAAFKRRQAELNDALATRMVEEVKQDAAKVLPPEQRP